MLKLRIKIDDSEARKMLARAPEVLARALARAASIALAALEAAVKRNIGAPYQGKPPAVAYGFLVNSVFGEVAASPLIGGVVAAHPPADIYAAVVEFGSRKHFPPIAPLIRWVQRKFGLTSASEARSAAFAVARTIAKRGTPAHLMFTRAIEQEQAGVQAAFDREIDAALEELQAED